ncbi:hypothetical protein [Bradyrhizobium cytisi]|uniref:Uncharacterized protein n=1 Tax=Bradyrhizobium cytisi TaxID=515489 RepID=A0A5S4WBZ6_9BRAD|nr:hypothetical protein [Bradyrhizobium cytisi]TYL76760.1 hypothetical protein FXB38_30695 [Bradyrhizobium cytisi]
MGMDVYGRSPKSPEGEYFRNNLWWWRPLAQYICEVAPEIAKNCEYWQSNQGDGLNDEDSLALACVLQKQIDSGQTAAWVEHHDSAQEDPEWSYFASVDNVQNFVVFLRECGGFAIC